MNNEMTIMMSAFDTLFFRDGKPFARGEETWADAVFPPSPSVFYGALRTCYFGSNPDDLKFANKGANDPTKDLCITSIMMMDKETDAYFVPMPLDCVTDEKEDEDKTKQRWVMKSIDVKSKGNYPLPEWFLENRHVKKLSDSFMLFSDFKRYLKGDQQLSEYYKIDRYVLREPKIGIGRTSSTHATTESMLYRVGMQRLKDMAFVVSFTGLPISVDGMMKLGGENKAVHYHSYKKPILDMTPPIERILKIVLTTPAIFNNGWYPEWLDAADNFTGMFEGVKVRLVNAAVGRSLFIGGFDMNAGKPKPMRKAVPAGSVYYFEVLDGDPRALVQKRQRTAISDIEKQRNEGFGIAYFGGLKS